MSEVCCCQPTVTTLYYLHSHMFSLICKLNLQEAVSLLGVVSNFDFKAYEKKPRFYIYDNQKAGHTLWVETASVSEEYRKFLEEIVKSRKLLFRNLDGYLIISGY